MFYEFFLNVFVTFNAIDVLFDIGINYIVNHYHMGVGFIDYVINNFFVGEVPGFLLGEHIGEIPLDDLDQPFSDNIIAVLRHQVFANVPIEQVTMTIEEAKEYYFSEMLKYFSLDEVQKIYDAWIEYFIDMADVEFNLIKNVHNTLDELAEHNEPLIMPIIG